MIADDLQSPALLMGMLQALAQRCALAAPTLAAMAAGATIWHINGDETEAPDCRGENIGSLFRPDPYRSSDHALSE